MKKTKLIYKAIRLRKEGFSLREISEIFSISKSTSSLWLRNVKVNRKGQERLEKRKEESIAKSKKVKKIQKANYLKIINQGCPVLKNGIFHLKDDLKIFLALLFWCEGSKKDRRLVFMNSDVEMVKAYLFLLRNTFKIKEERLVAVLHLHEYHNREKELKYWSKATGIKKKNISVYDKKNTGKRKRLDYRGCISIRYGDVRIIDELFLIIRRFVEKYAGVG